LAQTQVVPFKIAKTKFADVALTGELFESFRNDWMLKESMVGAAASAFEATVAVIKTLINLLMVVFI
jgi:hypothetical protein